MTTDRRIGILGGTFDPPHLGHLILAETACDMLSLSVVLFVPVGDPPHKPDAVITDVQHRVAMVNAAIVGNPRFTVSDIDITRPAPHYSVDTVRLIHEHHPDATLYFLIGGDSLKDIPTWHEPQRIYQQAQLAVMSRPGAAIDMVALEKQLPGIRDRIVFVEAPEIGISATLIRERLRNNHSIRYLVPNGVEEYIIEHRLYQNLNKSREVHHG
jgi:nicotinate-nucleotide adenylyltransferase